MIKDKVEVLISQVMASTAATLEIYNNEEGNSDREKIVSLISRFSSGTYHHTFTTRESLLGVSKEIFRSTAVTGYVLSLRFNSLAIFSEKEVEEIASNFAYAVSSSPERTIDSNLNVLPADDSIWVVDSAAVAKLFRANTWIIPLLALSFIGPEIINPEISNG